MQVQNWSSLCENVPTNTRCFLLLLKSGCFLHVFQHYTEKKSSIIFSAGLLRFFQGQYGHCMKKVYEAIHCHHSANKRCKYLNARHDGVADWHLLSSRKLFLGRSVKSHIKFLQTRFLFTITYFALSMKTENLCWCSKPPKPNKLHVHVFKR